MRKPWRRTEQRTLTYQPWTLWDASALTPSTSLANPDVYAATRVLADAAASCSLVVYRRLNDGGRSRAGGATTDLLQHPSEGTTQAGFVSTVMSHLLLWGNAYIGKYRDAEGRIEQLLPLGPDRVQVERRKGRIVFTVSDAETGRQTKHGFEDIVHIKALSTDGLVGLSPIKQMRQALELNNATRSASIALFKNNARPSGILTLPNANAETLEQIKEQWLATNTGDEQGGIAVMTGELSFQAIAMPADDAEFVAARRLAATEVARAFRIPPWMIGAEGGDSMTYSNTESQALAFAMFSLRPWLTAIEQALSVDGGLFSASTYCEFLLDALLRADSKTRAEVYTAALDPITGWLRRDEVRRLENLEPEPADPQATTSNGAGAKELVA